NSPSLTLTNVQTSDAGAYAVLVSNAVGSVVSTAVSLTVGNSGSNSGPVIWDFTSNAPSHGLPNDLSITGGVITAGSNNGTPPLLTNTPASATYAGASGGNNAGAAAPTGAFNPGASGSVYFESTLSAAPGKLVWFTGLSFGSRSTSTGPQAF